MPQRRWWIPLSSLGTSITCLAWWRYHNISCESTIPIHNHENKNENENDEVMLQSNFRKWRTSLSQKGHLAISFIPGTVRSVLEEKLQPEWKIPLLVSKQQSSSSSSHKEDSCVKTLSALGDIIINIENENKNNNELTLKIALEGTRYGNRTLLDCGKYHTFDPRLGLALQELIEKDVEGPFGHAHLVSLLTMVSSSSLNRSPIYVRFAWWALTQSSGASSMALRYQIKARLLRGENQVEKTKQKLLDNKIFWNSLAGSVHHDNAIQEQAADCLAHVSSGVVLPTTWTTERVALVHFWTKSDNIKIATSAWKVLLDMAQQCPKVLSDNDEILQLIRTRLMDHSRNTNTDVLLSILLALQGQQIMQDQYWTKQSPTSSSIHHRSHDSTLALASDADDAVENTIGFVPLVLHTLKQGHLNASKTLIGFCTDDSATSIVLREWIAESILVLSTRVPHLTNSTRVTTILCRKPPLISLNNPTILPVPETELVVLLRTLASLLNEPETHAAFLKMGGWSLLQQLVLEYSSSDLILQQVARSVANWTSSGAVVLSNEWIERARTWQRDKKDMKIVSNATRILTHTEESVVYRDGINPISVPISPPQVDIVFLHGLMGGAFESWKKGPISADSTVKTKDMWPAAWLAPDLLEQLDLPARILSVGYEANVLESYTAWPPLPLTNRAEVRLSTKNKGLIFEYLL